MVGLRLSRPPMASTCSIARSTSRTQMSTCERFGSGPFSVCTVRSWTGYELTRQVHRSLRFIWPTSEGHLYGSRSGS
jgi:hypothetical protein